jgi:chromosomal replication initiation ATPase DnaA
VKHDGNLSLTAIVVQMQRTILQLSARVEALEARERLRIAATIPQVVKRNPATVDRLTVLSVCEKVGRVHGLSLAEITGKRKTNKHVAARREIVRICREHGISTPRIGEAMKRDHTSIMNLERRRARG